MALLSGLNKAFDHRVRLGIMSTLLVQKKIEFNALKKLLEVSDGNLASHIKKLEDEQFIRIEKSFKGKKPNTTYFLTEKGAKAFKAHIDALEKIINQ